MVEGTWQGAWDEYRAEKLEGWSTEDEWLFRDAYLLGQADALRWATDRD